MERMNAMCKKCAGRGYTDETLIPNCDGMTCTVKRDICDECNGMGYTEYAVFTIEEAEAILKHCGLSAKS